VQGDAQVESGGAALLDFLIAPIAGSLRTSSVPFQAYEVRLYQISH
jgi:hypothetical protein